jgi:thiol-disulfide isomerase/thioredoxin
MKYLSILLYVLTIQSLYAQKEAEKTMPEKIHATADGLLLQNFTLKDIDGNTIDFASIDADIIVLDIWATWCGPCKDQAPHFDALREKLESERIKFISVSIDKKISPWQRYVKKKGLEAHHHWAGDDSYHPIEWLTYAFIEQDGKKMIVAGVPNFVIIGKDKIIYKRNAGFPKNGDLEKDVNALIEEYYGE